MGTVIKAGGSFSNSDLAGTWFFHTFADLPSSNDPTWNRGTITVNSNGTVTSGSAVDSDGLSDTISGGSLSISSSGVISGSITFSGGTAATISQGKMDVGKTTGSFVGIDNGNFRFIGTLIRAEADPAISVTPDSLGFGDVAVGSSAEKTFTVENTGSGTLTGSASTSAPLSIVSGGSYSLLEGQSQTVTVRFSPTEEVAFTGSVSFTGGGGTTKEVTGTGIPPTFTLTVT